MRECLAQQSTIKMKETQDHLSPSLFYRAILQVFLKTAGWFLINKFNFTRYIYLYYSYLLIFCQIGYKNVRLGRNAPTTNFLTYAKWALKKIKFPHVS